VRRAKQVLVALLAHLAVSFVGTLGVNTGLSFEANLFPRFSVTTFLLLVDIVGTAALFAVSIAGPAMVFAEWQGKGRWLFLSVVGIALSLALGTIFVFPLNSGGASFRWIVVAAPIAAALTCWFVAWCRFSPKLSVVPR